MIIQEILSLIARHKRTAVELFLGILTAFSMSFGISYYQHAKKAATELEMAKNNIEVYEERYDNSSYINGVLNKRLVDMTNSRDSLVHKLDSVSKVNKIKNKNIKTAATLKQTIYVNKSKGVRGDIIEILKDTIYTDSINYNNLTKVYYSIGKDSVDILLDILNTQYLYTFKTREYKNKKSLLKRIFTLDFKKVDRYKYKIVNTNDLLLESDIRIIAE